MKRKLWNEYEFFIDTEFDFFRFNDRTRKDLDRTHIKRHESSVINVIATLQNMINPFACDQTALVNLSSGLLASPETSKDLLGAEELGERCLLQFLEERILCDQPDIFSTIKRNNIRTFCSDITKKNVKDRKGTEIPVKMNRNLFARLLIIAKSINVDLQEVLKYSLGLYPLSLATVDGAFVKTAKAKLFHILEQSADAEANKSSFQGGAVIIDAMAVVQMLIKLPPTFADLADAIFEKIFSTAKNWNASRIYFVADTYPEMSIK